jgi:hypothetical protein
MTMRMHKMTLGGLLALAVALSCWFTTAASADFGLLSAGTALLGPEGESLRQAGSHPDFKTRIFFSRYLNPLRDVVEPDGKVRDVRVDLPVGLVANPQVAETCTDSQLRPPGNGGALDCPIGSQVGTITLGLKPDESLDTLEPIPLWNMMPKPGEPAEFGFILAGVPIKIVPQIRPTDYGISALSVQASQAATLFEIDITLWGVPAAHSHDTARNGALQIPARPFVRLPTSCASTEQTPLITADSWEHPDQSVSASESLDGTPFLFNGCDQLEFKPTISVQPSSRVAGAPTGLDVNLKVPQNENPEALATADVRRVSIRFPAGMSVSPSSAAGLGACSPAQIGIGTNEAPTCPESSKIGSVEVKTPLLAEPLHGDVIVAQQNDNPFGSLVALYLAIKGPGFYLKLPGRVDLDPASGQLTATFDDTPQLPFEELHLTLFSGPHASLVNGPGCGTFTAHTEVTSWASETPVSLDQPMSVSEGCDTAAFAPRLSAGSDIPEAGAFSGFHLRVVDEQSGSSPLARIDTTLPKGLLGLIKSVPLCPDAQAAAGTCSAASQIGTTTVSAGSGALPLVLPQAGRAPTAVYLAGPYEGAPFSLSIVVPAQAGPYDLGTVVVRAGLYVDPTTAQATVKSDPLPTILQGIPLDVRDLSVDIARPGFLFNATSCAAQAVTGAITPALGQTGAPAIGANGIGIPTQTGTAVAVSRPYGAVDCGKLAFKPKLTASTQGNGKFNGNGASLEVKLAAAEGPRSNGAAGESDIAKVEVELPKLLPSRLTTLQKACTEAQFATNPAGCPAASNVGSATASTAVLAHQLSGPAYLVSHGGAAFPDLVLVLQGEGVRIDLTGHTFISKAGITSSKFDSVPDAPISAFDLKLPEKPFSVLGVGLRGANATLCGQTLAMPTTITAQNGTVLKQSTPIAITGCKTAIRVASHKVSGSTATVLVGVPGAGKLVASGSGVGTVSKSAPGAKSVTVSLALSSNARATVRSKGKVKVKVRLVFAPRHGQKLTKSVTLSFK